MKDASQESSESANAAMRKFLEQYQLLEAVTVWKWPNPAVRLSISDCQPGKSAV
jgi:hypothetical protein